MLTSSSPQLLCSCLPHHFHPPWAFRSSGFALVGCSSCAQWQDLPQRSLTSALQFQTNGTAADLSRSCSSCEYHHCYCHGFWKVADLFCIIHHNVLPLFPVDFPHRPPHLIKRGRFSDEDVTRMWGPPPVCRRGVCSSPPPALPLAPPLLTLLPSLRTILRALLRRSAHPVHLSKQACFSGRPAGWGQGSAENEEVDKSRGD